MEAASHEIMDEFNPDRHKRGERRHFGSKNLLNSPDRNNGQTQEGRNGKPYLTAPLERGTAAGTTTADNTAADGLTTLPQGEAVLSGSTDELTTVLSDVLSGGLVEEITSGKEDYDIQIQGSDRKYPAVIFRRKHRGKGATIRTISKNGKYAAQYDDYQGIIEAYQARRQQRKGTVGSRHSQDGAEHLRSEWVDKTIQSVVKRPDNSEGDRGDL